MEIGEPYALVLLDAHMPEMDGYEVAKLIRQNELISGSPIMMLSSAGQYGEPARCDELGIELYLAKPVKQSELFSGIMSVLGAPGVITHTLDQVDGIEQSRLAQTYNVLLAEDNPVNQQLAVRLLEKCGHTVTVVDDGQKAVDMVEESSLTLF